jgi:hypothetical protein
LQDIIFFNNESIDVPSFCGCVGAPIPNLCDPCDDDTAVETTRSHSFYNGRSCNDLEVVYPFVTDEYYCEELREACCNDDPIVIVTECGLCPPGSDLLTPDLQVPFLGSDTTCASIDSDLSLFPASSCSGFQDQVNSLFDVAAWCGCDGANPPDFCSFCDDEEAMVHPDSEIAGSGGLTCTTAANLARFVTDPTVCSIEFAALSRGCCQSEDRCPICPDGSSLGLPERPYIFSEEPVTCFDFEFQIRFLAPQECETFNDAIPIDMASWCGCEGATSPKACSLCPDGYVVANENVEIPDWNGLTCGLAAELAEYVIDQQFCDEAVSVIGSECCKPAPPTSAPTADPDDGATSPNECSLCSDGYDVADANVEIPHSNGVTCGLAAELAQYVVDQQFCDESVSVFRSDCCKPVSDESPGTTNALLASFTLTFGGIFYLAFW